nr:MAG TPA: ENOD40 protein [Caudoviricetes sp.]
MGETTKQIIISKVKLVKGGIRINYEKYRDSYWDNLQLTSEEKQRRNSMMLSSIWAATLQPSCHSLEKSWNTASAPMKLCWLTALLENCR